MKIQYCVAQLNLNCKGEASVSYLAYNNPYGIHWDGDWNSKDVLWYDTEKEAKKHIWNANNCVIAKLR